MAFLQINGLTVPVKNASPSKGIRFESQLSRSYGGDMRDQRRGGRDNWDITTRVIELPHAHALEELVQGKGHFFDLADGLYAATSLGPRSGYSGIYFAPSKNTKFSIGGGAMFVEAAPTGEFMQIDTQLEFDDDCWTVMWLEDVDGLGDWRWFARNSDGIGMEDGVRDDTVGTAGGASDLYITIVDGVTIFAKTSASERPVDDIAILPYTIPESYMSALTSSTTKFSPVPLLRVSGDFLSPTHTYSFGQLKQSPYRTGYGKETVGFNNNLREVSFTLLQVEDRYLRDLEVPDIGTEDIPNNPPEVGPIPDFVFNV